MNNTKKVVTIQATFLVATLVLFGAANVHASEVTGNLDPASINSSGSQTGGTVGGNANGGSTVTGTINGGGGGGGGSTIGGFVSNPGGGGGSNNGGSNSNGNSNTIPPTVLGESTTNNPFPSLPNTGFDPANANNKNTSTAWLLYALSLGFIVAGTIYGVITLKRKNFL